MPFLDMVIQDLGKCHFSDNDIKDEVNAFLGAVLTVPTKRLGTPPDFQCILMALRVLLKRQ